LLKHLVDCAGTESSLGPHRSRRESGAWPRRRSASLALRAARSAAAAELRRSRRGSTNSPVRSAPATDMAGSTQWEKRARSAVARGQQCSSCRTRTRWSPPHRC
jgi:hypothetical protein